jgi:hypothetical protein
MRWKKRVVLDDQHLAVGAAFMPPPLDPASDLFEELVVIDDRLRDVVVGAALGQQSFRVSRASRARSRARPASTVVWDRS